MKLVWVFLCTYNKEWKTHCLLELELTVPISLVIRSTGVPKGLSFSNLKASLLEIPGVLAVHDLHVWSLTVGTTAIAVHLVIGT